MLTWLNFSLLPLLARICLVCMFPFSGLDKILHWQDALKQAKSSFLPGGRELLLLGMLVEFITPVCIVLGWHDHLAAFILAGFCVVTAILYHNFWAFPDFWAQGDSVAAAISGFSKKFRPGGRPASPYHRRHIPAAFHHPLPPACRRTHRGNATTMTEPAMTPQIHYWHLWTDESGISHQTKCALTNFDFMGVGDADPQWNNRQPRGEVNRGFHRPAGRVGG